MATINSIQDIVDSQEDLKAFQALSETAQTEVLDSLSPLFKSGSSEARQELMQFIGQQPTTIPLRDVPAQAIMSIPKSVVGVAGTMLDAVTHPRETIESLSKLGAGTVQKLIPGEQIFEKDFDAMFELLKDQYGGFENIKRSFANDPVRVATDASAFFGSPGNVVTMTRLATSLAKKTGNITRLNKIPGFKQAGDVVSELGKADILSSLETASRRGSFADPTSIFGATKIPSALTKGEIPAISTSLVKTAIKPSSVAKRGTTPAQKLSRADQLANEVISQKLFVTKGTVRKLDKSIKDTQAQIDQIIARGTLEGKTIRTRDMVDAIDDIDLSLDSLGIQTPDIITSRRTLQKFKEDTLASSPEFLTPTQAQNFKKFINRKYVPNAKEGVQHIRTVATDELNSLVRNELERAFPQLGVLNPNQGIRIELRNAIINKIKTIGEQPLVSTTGLLAGAAGAAATGAGFASLKEALAFAGGAILFEKVIKSPNIQILLAKSLNNANKLLAKTGRLDLLTSGAFQAGKVREELQKERGLQETFEDIERFQTQ